MQHPILTIIITALLGTLLCGIFDLSPGWTPFFLGFFLTYPVNYVIVKLQPVKEKNEN